MRLGAGPQQEASLLRKVSRKRSGQHPAEVETANQANHRQEKVVSAAGEEKRAVGEKINLKILHSVNVRFDD